MRCRRCLEARDKLPGLSRRDNKTKVCSPCAQEEGLLDYGMNESYKKGLITKAELLIIQHNEKRWLTGEEEQRFILEHTDEHGII